MKLIYKNVRKHYRVIFPYYILSKTIVKHGKYWHEKLPYALWAYRTNIRTFVGTTPFSLMYGDEAIFPLELEIPSLRASLDGLVPDEDRWKSRLA